MFNIPRFPLSPEASSINLDGVGWRVRHESGLYGSAIAFNRTRETYVLREEREAYRSNFAGENEVLSFENARFC